MICAEQAAAGDAFAGDTFRGAFFLNQDQIFSSTHHFRISDSGMAR